MPKRDIVENNYKIVCCLLCYTQCQAFTKKSVIAELMREHSVMTKLRDNFERAQLVNEVDLILIGFTWLPKEVSMKLVLTKLGWLMLELLF